MILSEVLFSPVRGRGGLLVTMSYGEPMKADLIIIDSSSGTSMH